MSPSQFITLPSLPAAHDAFIPYLASRPEAPIRTLVEPYNKYDAELRSIFAQQPSHPAISETHIVPVFDGHEEKVNIRARDLGSESDEEHERYIMPLAPEDRKPNGSPAIVQSLKEYQKNFAIFSESALSELDWSNVVVAGSAALTPLLPVPQEFTGSKRSLRRYYHEKVAPASDVDIFLYGMTEDQAKEKIQKIERHIRDSILSETTTVRTKNAITIVSEYPVRHVQIVLRIYRSISEMLAGFDVDCSCVAYDGTQVWASPRTLTACMTQINHIDLSRRSPSYENRLFKYARRGFEIHWDQLDRQRINPTIFECGFQRVVGLARLLVLEKLPEKQDRETYADQRRLERGRPRLNRYMTERHTLRGDIKAEHEYEVADWICEDDVSDYHTFTIPYGPKYHARKIEKLLYKKDLLLNGMLQVLMNIKIFRGADLTKPSGIDPKIARSTSTAIQLSLVVRRMSCAIVAAIVPIRSTQKKKKSPKKRPSGLFQAKLHSSKMIQAVKLLARSTLSQQQNGLRWHMSQTQRTCS